MFYVIAYFKKNSLGIIGEWLQSVDVSLLSFWSSPQMTVLPVENELQANLSVSEASPWLMFH